MSLRAILDQESIDTILNMRRSAAARPFDFVHMWRAKAIPEAGPGSNDATMKVLPYRVDFEGHEIECITMGFDFVEYETDWFRNLSIAAIGINGKAIPIKNPEIFTPILILFGFHKPDPSYDDHVWQFEEWIPYAPSIVLNPLQAKSA